MPVDAAFSRFDMARLYDAFNHHGEDGDFYENFAEAPCRVLDIGCGTGSVTLRLAKRGHQVTGVDPADGMLQMARMKDTEARVEWVQAAAAEFSLPDRFDLAIMTGHVFQVFLDDAETLAALRNIHRHMKPGGSVILESRNPLAKAWEDWTQAKTREQRVIDEVGSVEVFYQIKSVEAEHVTFDAVFSIKSHGRDADQREPAEVCKGRNNPAPACGSRLPRSRTARLVGSHTLFGHQSRNHRNRAGLNRMSDTKRPPRPRGDRDGLNLCDGSLTR